MKQENINSEPMPAVLKHIMKKCPTISKVEASKKALVMERCYAEANKERDDKRNVEYQKQWDRTLQKENDHWALEVLSGDALGEYFNVIKD